MHKIKVKMSTLMLSFCLAMMTAFTGAVVARADVQGNTLTVVTTNSTDAKYVEDIKKADAVVDVYRVADAIKDDTYDTYNYENWDAAFVSLQNRFDKLAQNHDDLASDWQDLYAAMAKLAPSARPVVKDQAMVDGQVALNLDDGLYLVLAHGTKAAEAHSEAFTYTFPPTMVALPTNLDAPSGGWVCEATIELKSSRTSLPDDPVSNKDTTPRTVRQAVQTGDDTQARLLPFYVAMAISGVALVAMAAYNAYLRHEDTKRGMR